MHVLYYLREFPGLSTSFITNEILELINLGNRVSVFALKEGESPILQNPERQPGLQVRYISHPSGIGLASPRLWRGNLLPLISDLRVLQGYRRKLITLHRIEDCLKFVESLEKDIDIVHTHFAIPATLPAKYVAAQVNVPMTITTHAFDLYHRPNMKALERILGSADTVITISNYNKNYISMTLDIDTPIRIVHAGIRPQKYNTSCKTNPRRLLTTSRLVEKKGIKYAIDAVSKLTSQYPSLSYHIVGEGPRHEELKQQIQRAGLDRSIELLGKVSEKRLISELSEAAMFILPCLVASSGDRDGIPVVLMEAMAAGTPPISTQVSGIPELINHGINGLLVPSRDDKKLAEAIKYLLANEHIRRSFANKGKDSVRKQFNVESEVKTLEKILDHHIKKMQ